MADKPQKTPIDAIKFWEGLEEREACPKSVQRALAMFASHYSENDSAQVKQFTMFQSYKTYNQ